MRQPLGVVAGITPFNFPAMIPLWKAGPALASGNAFVLKPSERDPSVPLRLAELFLEAGLPAGVFNVVNGDKESVDVLLEDPRIKAVGFVGSTPIAQDIYETAAKNGKRAQCFGGAKNHAIIMPDADMDQVADALVGAAYGAAGERCMALSVAVPVGEETADRLVAKLTERIADLRVGPGTDEKADFGPLVTAAARDRVHGYIAKGVEEGAELVVDGRDFVLAGHENGFFSGPTLFDKVTPGMSIYLEEIFGPVLTVVRAADYEEALRLPTEHEYGNGVAIFTRDGDTARDFTRRVEVGMVGVNVPIPVPIAYYTFGGWKASGFGDLNQHGPDAFRFYTKTKTVTQRFPSGVKEGDLEGATGATPTTSSSRPWTRRHRQCSHSPTTTGPSATPPATSPPSTWPRTRSNGIRRSTSRWTCCARPQHSAWAESTSVRTSADPGCDASTPSASSRNSPRVARRSPPTSPSTTWWRG